MEKTENRREWESGCMAYYRRLFKNSPSTAFEVIAQRMMDLEWELLCLRTPRPLTEDDCEDEGCFHKP